jgi:FAD synthase
MLKRQSNFLIVSLLIFAFIFSSYMPRVKTNPEISGKVIKGTGQTSLYGYPTANMVINTTLDNGIYTGKSRYGDVTIYSEDNFCVKCHIHKFKDNIIGKILKIYDVVLEV